MAQQVLDYLKEECFVCAVCMNRFKEPKMLSCHHTFCLTCLEKVSSSFGPLTCPTCRKATQLPFGGFQSLPSSFMIAGLMEKVDLANYSNPSSSACSSCHGKKDVFVCLDCKLNVCSTCKAFHDKIPGTDDHVTVPIDRSLDEDYMKEVLASYVPRCENHKGEKLVLFCLKCNQLICRDCKILDHSDHKAVTTDEGQSSVRSKLESLLGSVEVQSEIIQKISKEVDSSMSRIQEHATSVRKGVEGYYNDFVEKCKSDRDNLLAEIGRKEQHQLQPLQDVSEEVKKWNEEMKNTIELTRRILDERAKWKLLKDGNAHAETLQKLNEDERRLESIGTDIQLQKFSFRPSFRQSHFGNMLGNVCDEHANSKSNNMFEALLLKSSVNSVKPKKSGKVLDSAKPAARSSSSTTSKKSGDGSNMPRFDFGGLEPSANQKIIGDAPERPFRFGMPVSSRNPQKSHDGPLWPGSLSSSQASAPFVQPNKSGEAFKSSPFS